MRTITLVTILSLVGACRADGKTEFVVDRDEDGLSDEEDCDDEDPNVGSPTTYYADNDRDGHGDLQLGDSYCDQPVGFTTVGDDCNDADASIYSGAEDVCDGIDQDCDGQIDDGAAITTFYADADADGYGDDATAVDACAAPEGTTAVAGDCNDTDAAYNPDAIEEDCTDPNDYNCDGSVGFADADADGIAACEDCNDSDAGAYPGAAEYCNLQDDDCDGTVDEEALDAVTYYADLDSDNFGDAGVSVLACEQEDGWVLDATDCDDSRADINPTASEVCNELDDDCDGLIDDADDTLDVATAGTYYTDTDADGYGADATVVVACDQPVDASALPGDCDDTDTAYNPAAREDDCTDPNDYNCDNSVGYADADADGYAACEECDDLNADTFPGGIEVCDGEDNNCDGATDEPEAIDALIWYADTDVDTFGDASSSTMACDAPEGYVADPSDCDDTNDSVNPAQTEVCNGIDDNCDGTIDDGAADASIWYADTDNDLYGDAAATVESCDQPAGFVPTSDDCNDAVAAINPGATEYCDSLDNDCNGFVDEAAAVDASTWYADTDNDTFGDNGASTVDCYQPGSFVADNTDCNDNDADVYPFATEICNYTDDDCDTLVDEGVTTTYYADDDSDGYGDFAGTIQDCSAPRGYVGNDDDCDEGDEDTNPAATELCNGYDDDCDALTDEDVLTTYYADNDTDGYGDLANTTGACSVPSGYVATSTDCHDGDANIHPFATEICNGFDDDCDSAVDEGVTTTYYADNDDDGYGDLTNTTAACGLPVGYTNDTTDCDDDDEFINPAGTEVCNGYDDDCDTLIDESGSVGETTYYADDDSDTYGDPDETISACSTPSGYVSNDEDCEDGDYAINPDALEVCDTLDNDCDGNTDDAGDCPCAVEEYNDHVYMFCVVPGTWADDRTACLSYGYDLATINDAAENAWVVIEANKRGLPTDKWWTGGTDAASEGTWTWINGEAWSYTNWHSGEPNNVGSTPGGEDCMQLGRFGDATWNDEPCGSSFRSICEG